MRLAFTLAVCALAASVIPLVAAVQFPRANTKRGPITSAARSKVAQLQYRVKRDTIDRCASTTGAIFATSAGIPNPTNYAALTICVCLDVRYMYALRYAIANRRIFSLDCQQLA
jgi:hypothetical protein